MTTIYKPRGGPYVREAEATDVAPGESLIDRHSHFNGVYRTSHDLRIEGSAEGEIECDGTVTVAPDAHVEAKVRANNVVLAGEASGDIVCLAQFTLRPTGQMRGQVRAASLIVEEGAFFEGEFQMAEAQPTLTAPLQNAPPPLAFTPAPKENTAPMEEDEEEDDEAASAE